ncbi:MAG TPA: hypothetical protein VJ276_22590 [Thermoanaerobaculia bacterium]|nr:hypothetical protein [Thermoanaerobaculia bacterium]
MKALLSLGAILALASPLAADCVPHRVMKIVTAAEYADVPREAFASQPRTTYRLGDRYGRIEEPLNPNDDVQLIITINEPDIWMVNTVEMSGQHIVDPGPTFELHLPVLDAVDSKFWRQLEFGCEEPFMKAVGARVEKASNGALKYTHAAEGVTVALFISAGKPQRIEIATPKMQYAIRYVSYEMLAEDTAERFQRPQNVRFLEATQEK